MEELHPHGGVPPGWRLTVPPGDPRAGREVFAKLECFKCHAIQGERFPQVARGPEDAGPDLTGMGSHHPPEYLLESILNPNAVIVTGPGYTGPDGLSIMPDYRESLTVAELIDLVAYLQSLGGEHGHAPAGTRRRHIPAGASRKGTEAAAGLRRVGGRGERLLGVGLPGAAAAHPPRRARRGQARGPAQPPGPGLAFGAFWVVSGLLERWVQRASPGWSTGA